MNFTLEPQSLQEFRGTGSAVPVSQELSDPDWERIQNSGASAGQVSDAEFQRMLQAAHRTRSALALVPAQPKPRVESSVTTGFYGERVTKLSPSQWVAYREQCKRADAAGEP